MQTRSDDILSFTGLQGVPSLCRLRLFEQSDQPAVVIATELIDNPGTSVTNAAPQIAALACKRLARPENGMRFIEHYGRDGTEDYAQERFAEVTFSIGMGNVFRNPAWAHISKKALKPFSVRRFRRRISQFSCPAE